MHGATQTNLPPGLIMAGMEPDVMPKIVAAERLSDGILIKFADETCVFYSTRLLYELLPQAELQNEKVVLW